MLARATPEAALPDESPAWTALLDTTDVELEECGNIARDQQAGRRTANNCWALRQEVQLPLVMSRRLVIAEEHSHSTGREREQPGATQSRSAMRSRGPDGSREIVADSESPS